MAVPIHPMTPSDRALKRLQREQREEADARATVWAFLWTLFLFKIATVGVIWYIAAESTGEGMAVVAATTWYWLVIPFAAIAGPLVYRWRMVKMRQRRAQLQQAEWREDPHDPHLFVVHVPPGEQPRE